MKTVINESQLYTKTDACTFLGISRPTLDKWIKEGKINIILGLRERGYAYIPLHELKL